MTKQNKQEWRKEWELLVLDIFLKQKPPANKYPLGQLEKRGSDFIEDLLSSQKAIQHSISYNMGYKEGLKLAKKLPEMLIDSRVERKLTKLKAQIIKEIEGMKLAHTCTEVKCPHTDWKMFNKALSQVINKLKEEK